MPTIWKTYKLSEIIQIIGGGTPKTTVDEYWNGDIPWLSVVDFGKSAKTVYITEKTITEKGLKESSTKILKKGQLIISARGTVGELAMLGKDMAFNQSCYGLTATKETTNEFLYYLVKDSIGKIKQNTHGAVFDTITKQTFENIEVTIPDLTTQTQIAQILSSLDDKIELNLQMNQTLEAMAQALFKEWFVDFNYPDFDGELENGLPKGWRVGKLGEISLNFDNKRIPLSSMQRADRKGIYPYYGAATIFDYIDDYIFDGTYLLVGEDGTVSTSEGFPVLQYVWDKFWVNNHTHVLKGKSPFSTEYIYLLLSKTNITHLITGAVQPKINQGNMNKIESVLPTEKILNAFQEVIDPIFEKIKSNKNQIQTLTQTRDALLPKLMSGKIGIID